MKKILLVGVLMVFALTVSSVAMAQETEDVDTGEVASTTVEMPSNFGLWWQGVRESVSLAFTFDSLKKSEKALGYAERRMTMAENFADNSENPRAQELSEKMIERAQFMMEKIEEKRSKWETKDEEKKTRFVKRIAEHQEKREEVFDKLEEKMPEKKQERVRSLREKDLEINQRLIMAIENKNIPEDVREKLEERKMVIENHLIEVRQFNEEKRELMNRVREGDEGAREDLGKLRDERQEAVQTRIEKREEVMENNPDNGAMIQNRRDVGKTVIQESGAREGVPAEQNRMNK